MPFFLLLLVGAVALAARSKPRSVAPAAPVSGLGGRAPVGSAPSSPGAAIPMSVARPGLLFPTTPLMTVPQGLDSLPPDVRATVLQAIAAATDPNALMALANTLTLAGAPDAAAAVRGAADRLRDAMRWPGLKSLPEPSRTQALTAVKNVVYEGVFGPAAIGLPVGDLPYPLCNGTCPSSVNLTALANALESLGLSPLAVQELRTTVSRIVSQFS